MIRSPRIDSDFFRLRNPPPPVAPQNVEWCCIWDSVQSVEQPCMRTPADASDLPSRTSTHGSGSDVVRYSFIAMDFHLLLSAGLPGASDALLNHLFRSSVVHKRGRTQG